MGLRKASEIVHSSFLLKRTLKNRKTKWRHETKPHRGFILDIIISVLNTIWYNDARGQFQWIGLTFGGQASMTVFIGPDVSYPVEIQINFIFWGNSTGRNFAHRPSATTGKIIFCLRVSMCVHFLFTNLYFVFHALKIMEAKEFRSECEMLVSSIVFNKCVYIKAQANFSPSSKK